MASLFGGGRSAASSSVSFSSTLDSVPDMLGSLPDHHGLPTAVPVGDEMRGPTEPTGIPPPPAMMPANPLSLAPLPPTGHGSGGGGLALSDREVAVLRHSSTVDGRVFQVLYT
jgi:hypothetical protein